ncbi:MAG: DUF6297 family protein [Actinocatenispora sp.]
MPSPEQVEPAPVADWPEAVFELDRAGVVARTRETMALLRGLRRSHRREQAGNAAFTAYAALIGLFVYGGLLLPWLRGLSRSGQHGPDTAQLVGAAPPALIAVVLLLLLAVLRDALWRGPVTLPLPSATWLLPLPIDRGRLLRPRLRLQLVLGVLGGAVVGVVVAVALATGGATGAGLWALVGVSAGSFAITGLLAVGAGALVERYPAVGRRLRQFGPLVVVAALALAVQSGLAWYGHGVPMLVQVEAWSGPWGWAVQPVLAGAGRPEPGWPAALLGLGVLAVFAAVVADRVAAGVPGQALRARARSMTGFTTGLTTLNPRAAALEIRAARGTSARIRRLPRPHHPNLIVPWRDATALLRAPSRLAWSVVLTGVGYLFLALSRTAGNLYVSLALLAGGLVAGYLAVAQLTEPARLDADDPRRAGHLPYPFDRLALRHAIVPLLLTAVLAETGAVVAAVLAGSPVPLLVPLVSVPALVGAALVSAYRGPIPSTLFMGAETPMGNTGLINVAAWYAAGPLVAVVLLLPPMHLVLGHGTPDGSLVNYVLWGVAVAAALTYWAVRRATARAAGVRPD